MKGKSFGSEKELEELFVEQEKDGCLRSRMRKGGSRLSRSRGRLR